MMRLYLDRNLVKFNARAESKGYRLTHYVDGLSDAMFYIIKDWQNLLQDRLQADEKNIREEVVKLIEDEHVETAQEWDGYHCFIGIRHNHAILYFVPIESRETTYNTTGWHEFNNSFSVDVLRVHLAFSEEDPNRYAVYIDKVTKHFEKASLFLCCNILTSFKGLEVLAYATALLLGNYRELESDCLEFVKEAAQLASKHFASEREQNNKSGTNLRVKVVENMNDLTVTDLKSEALSRRNLASRYPALVSIVSIQSSFCNLILMFFVSLVAASLAIAVYDFFIR